MLIDLNHKSGFQYSTATPGAGHMGQVTPSNTQKRAIDAIKYWFQNETDEQQVFRLFGYAGTGKSTVLKFTLEELGIETHRSDKAGGSCVPGVVTATFTGKAALVLRRKGTLARTIHSLIYSVVEATEQEIEEARKTIEKLEIEARGITDTYSRIEAESRITWKREELSKMKRPRFALNPDSDAASCKLIVLDEVSMVGEEMARDLMSFKKPILVLGDPGQLPPIKGEGAFTKCQPDVMLTEIHRQAEESAIIRLATMARNGEYIPFWQYDEFVAKLPKSQVSAAQMLRGGQLICGRNATRFQLNNDMRYAAGLANGVLPTGPDDKIICLKNQNDLGLINGMFLTLDQIEDDDESFFSAVIVDDEGEAIGNAKRGGEPSRFPIYKGHFLDHLAFDTERHDRDWKTKKSLIEATFGWAITCHKAQGSQWENVIVWDDGLGRTDEDRRCWLYTAITRAEKGLVLLG